METSPFMMEKMKLLIDRLLQDPQLRSSMESPSRIEDFYAPLDYKGLGIRQYPQIVKYPMDLGTVKVGVDGFRDSSRS